MSSTIKVERVCVFMFYINSWLDVTTQVLILSTCFVCILIK